MGSPFASHTTSDPIPLPFDPEQWIQVRKLTGREHEAAQQAHRDGLALGRANVWSAFLRRALEHGATDPDVLKAIRDPLTGYDRYALVRAGLVAWSYPQSVKPVMAKHATEVGGAVSRPVVESDAVEDLDDEAVDFIATEILRLTKPQLFHATEADAEIEKKTADESASIVGREGTAAV
jgi:hypothetical protein